MKKILEIELLSFLKKSSCNEGPYLLGLSGGCDSMALFHLLLSCQKRLFFSFHAIYVDHGWRKESAEESEALERLCLEKGVPFHTFALKWEENERKTEELAREKRYALYKKVYEAIGAKALLLAHHKNDVAETCLKKVLEGTPLWHLTSLPARSFRLGMHILRPLIPFEKQALIVYLEKEGLSWFEDSTNQNTQYLRSSFRHVLFPQLEKEFGKNVQHNLAQLSERAALIEDFLGNRLTAFIQSGRASSWGYQWDFSEIKLHILEWEYVISKICKSQEILLSRELIAEMAFALAEGLSNKTYYSNGRHFYIDRKRLWVLVKPFQDFLWEKELKEDTKLFLGREDKFSYCLTLTSLKDKKTLKKSWLECWGSSYDVYLPQGDYLVVPYNRVKENKSLMKRLTNLRVPAFFKQAFPYLLGKDGMVIDFFGEIKSNNDLVSIFEVL